MGTWAGFTCALSSAGWVLFAHPLTFGFPKCGGWQFWGSTECSLSLGDEGPAAVPPARAEALEQAVDRNPVCISEVRAVPLVLFGLEGNKQASS